MWRRCSGLLAACRSCLRISSTRLAPASSRAWRGRVATPPALARSNTASAGKWLELLKELAPNLTRVAVLRDPALAAGIGQFAAIQALAPPSLGVELTPIDVQRPRRDRARHHRVRARAEWRPDRDGEPAGAVIHRNLIISLALRYRLPNVYGFRYYPASGGLASYGPDASRRAQARGCLRRSHPQGREARRPARCKRLPSTSWSSTSRPQRRSVLLCRQAVLARADEVIE